MIEFLIGALATGLVMGYHLDRKCSENTHLRRDLMRATGHPSQPLAAVHPISSSPKFAPIADLIASNEAARVDARWAQTVEDEFLNGFWGRP